MPKKRPGEDLVLGKDRMAWTSAERAEEARQMYKDKIVNHMTVRAIAEKYNCSTRTVQGRLNTYIPELLQNDVSVWREMENGKLDEMEELAWSIIKSEHLVVDKGQVVMHEGAPMRDDMPRLSAIDKLLKIQNQRTKLLGLDKPIKQEVSVTVSGPQEEDLKTLLAKAKEKRAMEEKRIRGELEAVIVDAEVVEDDGGS